MQQLDAYIENKHPNTIMVATLFILATYEFYGDIFKALYGSNFYFVDLIIIIIVFITFKQNVKINISNAILAMFFAIYIIIVTAINSGGWGSCYYIIKSVILLLLFSSARYHIKDIKRFAIFSLILSAYVISYSFLHTFYGNEGHIGAYNSNSIGTILFICSLFVNIYFSIFHEKILRIVPYNIVILICIYFTRSRTVLFSYLFSLLCIYVIKTRKTNSKIYSILFIVIVAFGTSVTAFYTHFFMNPDNSLFITIQRLSVIYFNKNINTGRETMWIDSLTTLEESLSNMLFGIGSHFSVNLSSNFHNAYLTLIICGGLIGYFIFILLVYKIYKLIIRRNTAISKKVALAYLSLLLFGSFEGITFAGNFSVLIYLFLSIGFTESPIETTILKKWSG